MLFRCHSRNRTALKLPQMKTFLPAAAASHWPGFVVEQSQDAGVSADCDRCF